MGKSKIPETGIYDARQLGTGRMLLLGFQHMFAMFGATVLVPALTGLSVSATLLFAGLGTLFFHFLTKGKVPAFLGSSFAYLAGYAAIAPNGEAALLPYACVGVAASGLLYLILAALVRGFGANRVMRFFPPVVTGPIIICIGMTLANSAINNCTGSWDIALVAILTVVIFNIWGKGMLRIIPILLGVLVSYVYAAVTGLSLKKKSARPAAADTTDAPTASGSASASEADEKPVRPVKKAAAGKSAGKGAKKPVSGKKSAGKTAPAKPKKKGTAGKAAK